MKLILKFFALLFCLQSFSQTSDNTEKIKNYIEAYFHYDRENLHIQFNKDIYLNNEDVAFKGYVFSKNSNTPNLNTTNIELIVYDDQQQIIQKQLLFAEFGTFSGGIHLNGKLKSGKYHFHFYTNWMNNFKEDDSFNQTIEIIDRKDNYHFENNEPDYKTAEVNLFPESGVIINNIVNTVGIKIKDCNKKGIEVKDGIILDSKSNEIAHFHTNKMGNGVVYFKADLNEKYTLKINTEKLKISKPLDKVQETGIVVSYNNNLAQNRLLVVVKTNDKGLEVYQNKKFILLIQQDGVFMQKEITFVDKKTDQISFFDKKFLSTGVNTIRILDENLNEVAERLVYIEGDTVPATTLEAKTTTTDSISLSGKTALNKPRLSISVLPENSVCMNQKRSLLGTFYLNAYLEQPELNTYDYYNPDNGNRKQDMELLMLNQNKSKFNWESIKSDPPKITFKFQKGVTVSGRVEQKQNSNSKNKMSLISLKSNLFEESPIDTDNAFKYEHFFAQDSTVLVLQMVNEKNVAQLTKVEARVSRDESRFVLGPTFDKSICPSPIKSENSFSFSPLKPEDNAINLEGVAVQNNFKKEVLIHKGDMSSSATAFKIKDNDYRSILNFLSFNGYKTGVNPNDNNVYVRNSRSTYLGDSATSPAVYIDNFLVFDLNQLFNLTLDQIDEIYIDQTGNSDQTASGNGTIKIFMKTDVKNKYFKPKYSSIVVTKGFAQNILFKNIKFETQDEFNYFGTLYWSSDLKLNDNSSFELKLPKNDQKEIQFLLEGFSDDGKLISEIRKIPVINTKS